MTHLYDVNRHQLGAPLSGQIFKEKTEDGLTQSPQSRRERLDRIYRMYRMFAQEGHGVQGVLNQASHSTLPLENLRVLSTVEGLMALSKTLSKVEGSRIEWAWF